MTEVVIVKRGKLRSVSLNGHAGHGKRGADIVCAAISILCAALDASCSGQPDYKSSGTGGNGEFFARYDGHSHEINAKFDMLITGLVLLEKTYPKNIKITTA